MLAGCVYTLPAEADRDATRLPEHVQEQLPLDLHLNNLCPSAETPPELERRLRRQGEALVRELERRPDWVVTYTFHFEDGTTEERDVTVRDFAEEELELLKSNDGRNGS